MVCTDAGIQIMSFIVDSVVHGLLPFIFTSKVSDSIHKLNEELS